MDPAAEVSHRMLGGGVSPLPADEGSGVEIAQVGVPAALGEAENSPAVAPLPTEGNEDAGLDKQQQDGAAPAASEANMDVDEAPLASEGTERQAATESKAEVNESGVLEKQQDVAAPVVSESKMEVDESSGPEREHAVVVAPPVKEDGEGECLVGRYVSRSASDDGTIRLGKVASYDGSIGMYSVVFEDGQGEELGLPNLEELGLPQLRELLMAEENGASGMKVSCRKRKLDLLVSPGSVKQAKGPPSTRQRGDACEMPARPDASQQNGCDPDLSGDAKYSRNSSDFNKELPAELCPPVQGPELPPSSADIAVPEESISHLFSVYNFLRSFSVQLFLSPFGLDDFVASINCTVQNTLLDAVHVSLLRALRRHLETKSSHGSELASDCLKYIVYLPLLN